VKYYISTGYLDTKEIVEIAKAADALGYLTDIALRRAARYDGWIGDLIKTDAAIAVAGQLRQYRNELGLPAAELAVLAPLIDAFRPADYERAEQGGVTQVLTMPWMFYSGADATLTEKIEGMKRFRRDLSLDTP
jgi:hypothetical protein